MWKLTVYKRIQRQSWKNKKTQPKIWRVLTQIWIQERIKFESKRNSELKKELPRKILEFNSSSKSKQHADTKVGQKIEKKLDISGIIDDNVRSGEDAGSVSRRQRL